MAGSAEEARTIDRPLGTELDGLRTRFEAAKGDMRDLISGLSNEEFNWRHNDEGWSIAECLDHLCMIGIAILPKIDEGVEKGKRNGIRSEGPYRYGFVGNWLIKNTGDDGGDPKRKFKAPDLYTPVSNHTISRLEKAFIDLQDEFVMRVEQANGLDLARIKVPSPALPLLRLSLGQWFALLEGHQRRHMRQARIVKAMLP